METTHTQWLEAIRQLHRVREIDAKVMMFRCFTCDCWFDGEQQLDNNFKSLGTEVRICPIAQAMLFDV